MGKPSNWYGGGGTTPLALNHPQWPKPINFFFFFFFLPWGGSATPDSATPLAKMGVAKGGGSTTPLLSFFSPFFNSFLFFSTFIILLFLINF
jgi:hypothetical protein